MGRNDTFNQIVSSVSEVTEISVEYILSDMRTTDVVDARCIVIRLLSEQGFYRSFICEKMHRTEAGVRYLLAIYDERYDTNNWFRCNVEAIRKQLRSIY